MYMYCMYIQVLVSFVLYNTSYMYCNMYCICIIHTCIVHGEYIEKNVNLIAQVSVVIAILFRIFHLLPCFYIN